VVRHQAAAAISSTVNVVVGVNQVRAGIVVGYFTEGGW
jgi:hypothetical protein